MPTGLYRRRGLHRSSITGVATDTDDVDAAKGSQVLSCASMNVVATLEGEVIYVMVRPSSGVERCMLPMMVYLANAALDNGGYYCTCPSV